MEYSFIVRGGGKCFFLSLVQYGYILNSISCFRVPDLVDGSIVLVLPHTCELATEIQQEVANFGEVLKLRVRVYMEVSQRNPQVLDLS